MRRTPLRDLTPADFDAWAQLAARAAEPNPFFEPQFVTAVARSPNAKPPDLLVMERDGAWIACMPVQSIRPFGLCTWRHPYAYAATPLVEPTAVDEFASALLSEVGLWRPGRQIAVLWEAIDLSIVAAIRRAAAASKHAAVIVEWPAERAACERSTEPSVNYLSSLKRKRRKELERKREQLQEELGSELTVTNYSGEAEVVETFLRLEASGWKGSEGTAMASTGDAEMFRSICTGFSRERRLQILALEAAGKAVAMQCNLSAGDALYCFKVAFDEDYRRFAPGIQLEIDSLQDFQDNRTEAVLDTCAAPANDFLNKLWPDRRRTTIMVIGPGGVAGRLGGRLLEAAARHRVKRRQG